MSDDPPAGIALTAIGYKLKGTKHADLTWTGATTTHVDVYVDGSNVGATANDGAATVNLNSKGGGTQLFKVCETGTSSCSDDVLVTY